MLKYLVLLTLGLFLLIGCSSGFKSIQSDPYDIVSCGSTEDNFLFLKYSRYTGKAWILQEGWMPIPDNEELPESNYIIKVVSMPGHRYSAVRIDTKTGRSWSSINNRWVEIDPKSTKFFGVNRGVNE